MPVRARHTHLLPKSPVRILDAFVGISLLERWLSALAACGWKF